MGPTDPAELVGYDHVLFEPDDERAAGGSR